MKFARWKCLCPTREEKFPLDRHEAIKDCIELTDHTTAKAARPEGVTISMVRYAAMGEIGIYKRKMFSI